MYTPDANTQVYSMHANYTNLVNTNPQFNYSTDTTNEHTAPHYLYLQVFIEIKS